MKFSISDQCGLLRLTWTHVWSSPSPVSSSNYCATTIYRVILALCVGKRLCTLSNLTKYYFFHKWTNLLFLEKFNSTWIALQKIIVSYHLKQLAKIKERPTSRSTNFLHILWFYNLYASGGVHLCKIQNDDLKNSIRNQRAWNKIYTTAKKDFFMILHASGTVHLFKI